MVITTYLRYLLITLTVSMFSVSASSAEICKTLTATGNSEYPPYLWRKGAGGNELLGANRLIMDEIAARLGVTIKLQDVGSWARAQEMLKTGRIDLLAGAFYTVPRIQYMDYVYPAFLDTTSVVWRPKGAAMQYQSKADLIGRSGVTVINNSFGQAFDEFAKAKLDLVYVASLEQAFKMIKRGRADYVLYEKNPGLAYADLLGFKADLEVLSPEISREGLYLTISHKSDCNTGKLRGLLAKTVQEMIAEGFMRKALQQGLEHWSEFSK